MKTIAEIKADLAKVTSPDDPLLLEVQTDARKGVQRLIMSCLVRLHQEAKLVEKHTEMFEFERNLWANGYHLIAGVDEVGRGPLVGPVVASAVILPEDFQLLGLNDSKQLSEEKREDFYTIIKQEALAVGVGVSDNIEIDRVNIYQATKLAMMRAIEDLDVCPDYLLLDAMTLDLDLPQTSLVKGDARSNSIAAASIVAKVTRDKMMKDYANQYPGYGFEKNMGYGTMVHLDGIKRLGPTPWHRMTFAPLKDL